MAQESLFAVVLAAGRGKRFGATKQLARYDEMPLVTRAVRTAEAVCDGRVLLVTGSDHERVAAACAPLRGFVTVNEVSRELKVEGQTEDDVGEHFVAIILTAEDGRTANFGLELLVESAQTGSEAIDADKNESYLEQNQNSVIPTGWV